MKIVIPGGTGHLGLLLTHALARAGHEVVILSRRPDTRVPDARTVPWDGRNQGGWATEVDGADAVVNLAGRSVNCRYTEPNLREMMASRVDSARVVGAAIARTGVSASTSRGSGNASRARRRRRAPARSRSARAS